MIALAPGRVYRLVAPMLVLTGALASVSSPASAHPGMIRVGCSNERHPRLIVSVPPGLLDRGRPVGLPPANDWIKGLWAFDVCEIGTAPSDEPLGRVCRLQPGGVIALRRVQFGPGVLMMEPASFTPILTRDGDAFAFASDAAGDFHVMLLTALDRPGASWATVQLVDLTGACGDSEPFSMQLCTVDRLSDAVNEYVCPMRCEKATTFSAPGRCPVCRMKLMHVLAHMDHTPRHGGSFFMAPDGDHHVEGALTGDGEMRLWFYDEFTGPISGQAFRATGTAWIRDEESETSLVLTPSLDGAYLRAPVDPRLARPIRVKLFVDFGDGQPPPAFDFEFEK